MPEPAPVVRFIAREDVLWNRPLFKAPALEVLPNVFNGAALASEFRQMILGKP